MQIMTPRRWGKVQLFCIALFHRFWQTMCVSMLVAVLLYVCRKITIVCFATSQDISSAFLATTRALFLQLPGAEKRLLNNNATSLYIRRYDDDFTRPSGLVQDLRDFNAIIARPATVGSEYFFLFVVFLFLFYGFGSVRFKR
jgi:hypothetical protein